LGFPQQAVRELDKAVQLEPRDPAARKLHDIFAAKIGAPAVGPPPQVQQPQNGPQPGAAELPTPAAEPKTGALPTGPLILPAS
jgi:hypothetical protein